MSDAMIEIQAVTRRFGRQVAVDDVSLDVPSGTITVLVGTSGSGKSTLMRMINRLIEPTSGTIRINGRDTGQISPEELRRGIGYAIQGHGLFPHWTVARNIATVPTLLGWDKARIDTRVTELLNLFHLDPAIFAEKLPHQLSGGQQQRVGVARALAAEPAILLMDEPFGALDPIIRQTAQDELVALQRRLGITVVLVTHDMEEALHLGDQIAVMDGGRILQAASPRDILIDPAPGFVERLIAGADRPLRLLSLGTVGELAQVGVAEGEPLDASMSQRDALAIMLWRGVEALPVKAENGSGDRVVTFETLRQVAGRPA